MTNRDDNKLTVLYPSPDLEHEQVTVSDWSEFEQCQPERCEARSPYTGKQCRTGAGHDGRHDDGTRRWLHLGE